MDEANGRGGLADCGGYALDRSAARVTRCECARAVGDVIPTALAHSEHYGLHDHTTFHRRDHRVRRSEIDTDSSAQTRSMSAQPCCSARARPPSRVRVSSEGNRARDTVRAARAGGSQATLGQQLGQAWSRPGIDPNGQLRL